MPRQGHLPGQDVSTPPTSRQELPSAHRRNRALGFPSLRPRGPARHVAVAVPLVVALLIILVGGYGEHWSWTGYIHQGKPLTLWDWLSVSLLPLTLALTPVWLKSRTRHPRTWRAAALASLGVLLVLLVGGYLRRWQWTGFTGNNLWDWVSLFFVPFLLPFAFHFLAADDSRREAEVTAADDGGPGAATTGRTERVAPWLGAAALTLGVLLALGMVAAGQPASQAHAPAAALSSAVTIRTASVTVDSRSQHWTDTHLDLRRGDRVEVTASGRVLPSPRSGYHFVSPAGLEPPHPGQRSIDEAIPHAALIATIAAHQPAPLHSIRPRLVLPVGAHRTFTVSTAGRLYLGLNDKVTVDNTGWYQANVTVLEHGAAPGVKRVRSSRASG